MRQETTLGQLGRCHVPVPSDHPGTSELRQETSQQTEDDPAGALKTEPVHHMDRDGHKAPRIKPLMHTGHKRDMVRALTRPLS